MSSGPSTHQDSPCERCGGYKLTVRSLAVNAPLVPCPDCNPAPTQVEGEPLDNYKQSALTKTVIERLEQREAEAAEALAKWKAAHPGRHDSPSALVSYTEKRIYRDAILAIADADLEQFVFEQPEGGDEEDWPEVWVARNDAPGGLVLIVAEKEAEQWRSIGRSVRHYVPAKEDGR